uniref:Uncharacterized protein n=1 Tax=Arundo donax TaxID=35708 RepID=A0A0A8YPJ3_ARUDO
MVLAGHRRLAARGGRAVSGEGGDGLGVGFDSGLQ